MNLFFFFLDALAQVQGLEEDSVSKGDWIQWRGSTQDSTWMEFVRCSQG